MFFFFFDENQTMPVSEFLASNNVSPLLLGAFYSRYQFTNDNRNIYTEVSYKVSDYAKDYKLLIDSKKDLLNKLNQICTPHSFWQDCTSNSEHPRITLRFFLDNDLNLNPKNFYNQLNVKLLSQDYLYEDVLTEQKKMFIRGFAESRGSVDTTRHLLAMDYFYNSEYELKRARVLYDYFNVPFSSLNFNPRELQKQFVTGISKRNTQLRFNLYWYVRNIGLLNCYKIAIVKNAYTNITFSHTDGFVSYFNAPEIMNRNKDSFDNMLRYYSNNIFGKDLSKFEIDNLRQELNFNTATDIVHFKRNLALIEIVRLKTPDKCASCGTTQTYTHKNTGRQYFEYHHVISVGKNHELDDENNIVKLCPNCHRIVKRGSAPENEQKQVIINILQNQSNVLEFAKQIYDIDDIDKIVDKVWQSLK